MPRKLNHYVIQVCRIGYGHRLIEVDAENRSLAEGKALEEAPNHEFSEHSSKYEVS